MTILSDLSTTSLQLGRAQGPGDQVEGFLAFGERDVGQGRGGAVGGDAGDGDDAHLGVAGA